MKKGKGKYQMLDNLNSKFESSRVQALDVNDDEVEIDLLEIFHALRKKILLVLMVALIGGCIGAACTQFLMTPIYSSTSSMLVLSKETTLTSLADLQLGASLTSDYTVLITSTPVLEQVVTNLNLDMTAENLKDFPSGNGVRIDTALFNGCSVSPFYDSMLAKIIVYDSERKKAIRKMKNVLKKIKIDGIITNLEFQNAILNHRDFEEGNFTTDFIVDKFS